MRIFATQFGFDMVTYNLPKKSDPKHLTKFLQREIEEIFTKKQKKLLVFDDW